MIFSDLELSRRLETTEALANVGSVEARRQLQPESGATWMEVDGVYAMFDGRRSPLTQTFGLGLQQATAATLDRIEEFFRERQAPVFHEVTPMAVPALLDLLNGRGYQPVELTSVMFRPLTGLAEDTTPGLQVRRVEPDEYELWAQTAARGWSEAAELAELILDLSRVSAYNRSAAVFLVEREARPIATGSLIVHNGVGLLAGAATVPEARRLGAQRALLGVRLRHALAGGCDLAMMCAAPGSSSQRNAERHGFRIAYTRIKWGLGVGSGGE